MKEAVLIIESDEAEREFLQRLLERENFQVFATGDGYEGFDYLAEQPGIKLVLLDMALADPTGVAMLEMLQVREHTPPTLAIVGRDNTAAIQEAIEAGAHDCLQMPFDRVEVMEKVKLVLHSKEARGRRVAHRKQVNIQAEVPINILDISETGVRFRSSCKLEKGSIIFFNSTAMAVKLDIANNQRFTVRVAYSSGSGNSWVVGGAFVGLPAEVTRKIRQMNHTGAWWK